MRDTAPRPPGREKTGRRAPAALAALAALAACARRPEPVAELWIGGDVHLGGASAPLFEAAPAALAGAVGVVNLEGPVATPEGPRSLANAPARLAALRAAGVRVAGIANNHALDDGPAGPARTARAVRAAGLVPAGDPAGDATLDAGGLRVVVTAHDLTRGVPADLASRLSRARRRGDALVATFHVTGPPSYLPRPELRSAVAAALGAGARVVAAHGTHALGPAERRGGAAVAWGLGNLAFECDCTEEREGAVLRVSVRRDGVRAALVPVEAGLGGRGARPSPDAAGVFDLLAAIGSRGLTRRGAAAWF